MKRSTLAPAAAAQRGAATLIVVMVLFFIVTLVAAYTNRNLIFEQRTSTNQYRSTQALEAAEAGVEWALAMLNHQRLSDTPASTCGNAAEPPSPLPQDRSYRQRYLTTDPTTGNLAPTLKADGTPLAQACVFNGAGWNCSCPANSDLPTPLAPGGNNVNPAFQVRLEQIAPPGRHGVIRIHAVGCTRLDTACLAFDGQGLSQEGRAEVKVLVALTGNAVSPPSATVLARNDITLTAAAPPATVFNTDPAGSGITLQAGGAINSPNVVLHSTPGTPGSQSTVAADTALNLVAAVPFSANDRMFATVFNMTSASFQQQPAAWVLPCGGGTCTAADVRSAIVTHPGRPLWLQGNLDVDSVGDIGSAVEPVLLVINGNLTFTTAGVKVYGLVYARTANWVTAGSGEIHGAAVAEGSISGAGTPTFVRDTDVLRRLRYGTGSFVRVPGSWVDFR